MKKISTDIARIKRQLINKVAKKGLYENFGQKEVRRLEENHINSSDYSDEMNYVRNKIDSFNEWCITYDG